MKHFIKYKFIYMTIPLPKVLKKKPLKWKVANLEHEWNVLRKWTYFEANLKKKSAFGTKWYRPTLKWINGLITVKPKVSKLKCFLSDTLVALFKMNICTITLIFSVIHYFFPSLMCLLKGVIYIFPLVLLLNYKFIACIWPDSLKV